MLKTHMGIERYPVQVDQTGEESRTQQHHKDETDINLIVNRFKDTSILEHLNQNPLQYGEATSQTFTEAMHTVSAAQNQFSELPSEVRRYFQNDVAIFLDAASDPEQKKLFQDFGLLPEDPKSTPVEPSTSVEATVPVAEAPAESPE